MRVAAIILAILLAGAIPADAHAVRTSPGYRIPCDETLIASGQTAPSAGRILRSEVATDRGISASTGFVLYTGCGQFFIDQKRPVVDAIFMSGFE